MSIVSENKISFETYGKWILAGEHAVLRGSMALVFPLKGFSMKFAYEQNSSPLDFAVSGINDWDLIHVVRKLNKHALQLLKSEGLVSEDAEHLLSGMLRIESGIPLGAGLGASAALCSGFAKLLAHHNFIDVSHTYELARKLEGLFHSESSGVDIAVALEGLPLRFKRNGLREVFQPTWLPPIYLSYCGARGATSDCVKKVNQLSARDPELGKKLDQQMISAVALCEEALLQNRNSGVELLKKAFDLADETFRAWGLSDDRLGEHLLELKKQGAIAVKPTGSGGGGYVLSLWPDTPPPSYVHERRLIPLFSQV